MRAVRRQVEHVSRGEHPFPACAKPTQYLQWCIFDQRQIPLPADFPAATTFALQQEYVITVEVRSYTAAWRCIANHQVIEAGVGDEGKLIQQLLRLRQYVINTLNEQRPVAGGKSREITFAEWSGGDLPAPAIADDQTCFGIRRLRHFHQVCACYQRRELWQA